MITLQVIIMLIITITTGYQTYHENWAIAATQSIALFVAAVFFLAMIIEENS